MIEFDYDGVDSTLDELEQTLKSLEEAKEEYSSIINNISSSKSWISQEKGMVVSMAKEQYLNYISDNIKNIQNLKAQVQNKKNDFIDAENQVKALSI